MALVIPAGSSASIKTLTAGTAGSPTDLTNLKTVGGSTVSRTMADVTALGDTTLQRIPSRNDKGTLQLTFFLTDTATATNQITNFKTRLTDGTHSRINVNLTGSTIDDMFQYDGYVTEVGEPEIGASDDALTYTVTMQRSDKY
jgi:hypothetical protein